MSERRKIAVSVSGAISLGAYQAGVIYELFSLMRSVEEDPTVPVEKKFTMDVITGASAGSVNSVVLALAMMYDPAIIEFVKRIWIDGLDLSTLLEEVKEPGHSIFSNRIILQLKQDLLDAVQNSGAKALPYFPDQVKLTLTLSNLTGVPYLIHFANKKQGYPLTTFADWFSQDLKKNDASPAAIQAVDRLIDMAIASGSFPFAFPPQELKRFYEDYKQTAVTRPPPGEMLDFVYVDGGVFNNEPINRARELADKLDNAQTNRIYLLIDPSPPEAEKPFDSLNMLDVGFRLVPAVFTEAHFRDWYQAIKVNQRLQWQMSLVRATRTRLAQLAGVQLQAVNAAWEDVCGEIAQFKAAKAGWNDWHDYLGKERQRIREFLSVEKIVDLNAQPDLTNSMVNFIFVIENIGSLRGKKILDIRLLSPLQKGMLAGDFLISFGGFFSPHYRRHDFNIGREVARDFVSQPESEGGLGLDISLYPLEAIPYDKNLNEVSMKDAPLEHRIKLRDNALKRVDTLVDGYLQNHGVKWYVRLAAPVGLFLGAAVASVVSWRWLIRKLVQWFLKGILNSQLSISGAEKVPPKPEVHI